MDARGVWVPDETIVYREEATEKMFDVNQHNFDTITASWIIWQVNYIVFIIFLSID